jgi:hypothetical protein
MLGQGAVLSQPDVIRRDIVRANHQLGGDMYTKRLLAIVACALLIARVASAQTFGQVTGIVTDSTGGVLPSATITVTNTQTGAVVTQQANSAGNYVFPNLLPGTYSVKVDMDGFRSVARNMELQVAQTIRLDFKLELGTLSETVVAVGTAPMMNTEDAVIGTVIDNKRILELPLNGRNFLKMVELTPNVSASFTTGSVGSSGPRQGGDRSAQQISTSRSTARTTPM